MQTRLRRNIASALIGESVAILFIALL